MQWQFRKHTFNSVTYCFWLHLRMISDSAPFSVLHNIVPVWRRTSSDTRDESLNWSTGFFKLMIIGVPCVAYDCRHHYVVCFISIPANRVWLMSCVLPLMKGWIESIVIWHNIYMFLILVSSMSEQILYWKAISEYVDFNWVAWHFYF